MEEQVAWDEIEVWNEMEDEAAVNDLAKQGIEVWASVARAPTRYRVSNLGRVAACTRGRPWELIKIRAKLNKYPSVGIYVNPGDRRPWTVMVHRLVLLTFYGTPPPGMTDARHLNGNTHDARLCNLQWGTRHENMRDIWEHRRQPVDDDRLVLPAPVPNPTYTLSEEVLTRVLRLFEQGRLTLDDAAVLLRTSRDVARPALLGTTWPHLERNQEAIMHFLGREGTSHHKTTVSDEDLARAFQLYTDNHWSGVQFAAHLGIMQLTAHSILKGRTRNNVPRPPGFVYPWPNAASMNRKTGSSHGCAKVSEIELADVFDRIVSGELETLKDVQAALGLSKGIVYGILRGDTWTHVPRPEGWLEARSRLMPRYKGDPTKDAASLAAPT